MRRTLLLLFIVFPFLLQSQNLENHLQSNDGGIIQKEDLIGLELGELVDLGFANPANLHQSQPNGQMDYSREDCFDSYIPLDQATYTPVPRNDDGSLFLPSLGFTFSFCGSTYTDLYINTNGNLSFGAPVAQFSPDGFPYPTAMVAPFWADVDTRNTACEQAWYFLAANYLIVTWENVGWYNQNCSPLNTFQVIISDGTAGIIGVGNNIQFRYGDMEWTTGTASGGGPFGGSAATVGYNSGDNVNFEQIGRFNEDNSNYDGPFGANDGVHWLDNKCFVFDADGGAFTLSCNDITRSLDANCNVNITEDDIAVLSVDGCTAVDVEIDITSFGCDDVGMNTVTITATSGGTTLTCSALVEIVEGLCSAPSITPAGPFCNEDVPFALTANPFGGTWGGAAPGGVFDPSTAGPGTHTVTYTSLNSCPTMTTIDIVVNANPTVSISPDPPEFCEDDGGVPLIATGSGGDGNYTFLWTTPFGNMSGEVIAATLPGLYTVSVTDGNGCGSLAFTNVTSNPNPVVVIFDPGPICITEVAVQLQGSPSGGTWSGIFVTPDGFIFPQNMPPGITQVTYTYMNNFGCETSTTADIEIVPAPDAFATNGGPYCEGETIELFGNSNAPGIVFYNWMGPNGYTSSEQNPTDATEPGAYVLEVILGSCTSELTPTIVEVTAAPIAVAANDGPYCPGQTISLFGATTSTGTIIEYEWTGPGSYTSSEQNPTDATEAGAYILNITVDGCASPLTTTVVEFDAAPIAIASNLGPYCTGDNISLLGSTTSSGASITYSWTGPGIYTSMEQNPTDATEPGVYILEISVDGCDSEESTTTVVINALPEPIITGDDSFCEGGNSIVDAGSGYVDYDWSDGTSSQQTLMDETGIITVTVTDVNGCTGETSFTATENPNPTPSITGSTSFCTGSATLLDAGSGYVDYDWSNGESSQTVSVSTPGDITVIVTDANGCTGENTVTIIENDLLSPIITGELNLCEGENSVLNAGSGFETYLWSDGSITQAILAETEGDYSVTVTDLSGCTGENTVSLVINDNPDPAITGDDTLCEGDAASLDAGDGYDIYEWSEGSGSQTISVNSTGTYLVTVTDINGCTGETQFDVSVNPNPIPTITGSTSFCTGSSTTLDAGTGYDNYDWSNGESSQTISVSTPGDYSVIVTDDNGCTGETMVNVSENENLSPIIAGDLNLCEGENSTLDAGTGFDTYLWSNGADTQTIIADATGDYSVTVTDINGCTGENTVALVINDNPDPAITGDDTLCEGDASSLDAGNGYDIYEWSEGSGSQTISVSSSGTYIVTVTDGNGCTGETQFSVTVNTNPTPVITGDNTFCEGGDVTLDAGVYDTYSWSNGGTTQTINITTGDTYSVTVTDTNGCTGETQFTVDENGLAPPTISGIVEFCNGLNSTLDAGSGYNEYDWSDGSIDQTITVSTSGIYSVTVTDTNGCTAENEVNIVVNDNPTPNISGSTAFCEGSNSSLDAGSGFVDYIWSDGSINQTLEVTTSGTYSVTITDANGCTGEDDINITVNQNPEPTIAGSTTFCSGFSTTLDAGSGYDIYAWSDGSAGQTLEVDAGGTYIVTVTDTNGCTGEVSVDIEESSSLNPVVSGLLEYCVGDNTILDAGSGFETYEWSNGSSEQTITVDAPDDYSVTVTDANGCSGETTVSIIENDLPSLNITGNNPICTGESLTLDAGLGFEDYIWSDLSLNQTIEVTAGGSYSVTVTDINGCTNEASINVTENPVPIPTIDGNSSFCEGESVTLDAGIYDQYIWSDGTTNQTLDITIGGTYFVTVTDINGCTGEDQFTVSSNQIPDPEILGDLDFCEGSSTTLSAPDGFDYSWSTGSALQTITIDLDGNIGLTITDVNGCTGETSVALIENPNPDPTIAGSTTFCIGNSSTIDAGAGYDEYLWSDGSLNQTLEVTVEGDYSVTVTNANGCTGEAQISITESQSLAPVIAGIENVCAGESSTFDAGSGFETYLWSNGEITQSITVDTENDYSVTVSDASGCTGESTVSFVINQNPLATITGLSEFCEGDASTLDAGNGFETYLWSNGEITQTIEVSTTDSYSVTIVDINGCEDEAQIDVLVNPNPDPIITGPSSFCSGNSATLDAGTGYDTYFWSNGEITQTIEVTDGDTYSVTVTTAAGCSAESFVDVLENSSLTPVISGDLDFCEGDNSILDAGTGYASYEWSTGEVTQTIMVTENGNYGVFVTDADGCSGSSNISVTTFQNPDPIIAGSTTFCTGSSTTLDAGNYDNYLWSNGETTQTITVNSPGVYSVDILDLNGCSGSAFIDVTESTSLNPVISGQPAFCTGGSTIIDAGAGFETYLWSDGSTSQTLEVGLATDYSVTVSDASGCTGETTISIIENMPPQAELAIGPELCNTNAGGSITNLYDLILSGDDTGSWEDADNSGALGLFDNLNFDGIPAGVYNFIYTTNSAISPCEEVSYTITVSVIDCSCPPVSFNAADPLCNIDGTLDLTSILNTSENGTWSIITNPGGGNPATITNQVFDATSADPGDYELEFTLTDMPPTGCPETFMTALTVVDEVFAGTVAMQMEFCEDENQTVTLESLLDNEDPNGTWTEVSGVPSQGGAFDPANGSFNMVGQNPGTYTFEYSLSPGGACPDDSEVVTVIVNELPVAIAGSSITLDCTNPQLNLNAIGSSSGSSFNIEWSGGVIIDGNENTLTPNVDQSGVYVLTITNTQTGCISTDIVEVFQSDDIPTAFAGMDEELTCDDTSISLQATGDVGPGFEVEWQGPSITVSNMNDLSPVIDLAGIYILTSTNTDNGCTSAPDTIIVSNNSEAPNVVIETPLDINCFSNIVEIIGTSPNPDVSYEWFFNNVSIGTDAILTGVNSPGFYTLIITDNQTGCPGSETIEVFQDLDPPLANAGPPATIDCYNPVVTIDGSNSQNGLDIGYNWSGPGIISTPDGTGIETVNLPGMYIINITDLNNGCESFDTVIIDANLTAPNAEIVDPEQLDCTVDEVSLDGSGSSSGNNYVYTWIDETGNSISSSNNIDVQSTGTYLLAIQDIENGCVDTASVYVSENMDVPYSGAFLINNPDCFGDTDGNISVNEVYGGVAPYIYSVNGAPFSTTSFYSSLSPGSYELLLQDANGCEWDTLINITAPIEVEVDLGTNLELEIGDSAIVNAQINIPLDQLDTILWTPASLIECGDPNCLEIGFSSFLTQNLTATVIDINGCTAEDNITVLMDRTKRVFIPNVFTPNDDTNNDVFMIFADEEQVVNINKFMVFNRWGELVYEGLNFQPNNPDEGWNGKFRGETMNPAVFVYLAEIEFIDGTVELFKGDVTLAK